ncbi:MAG: hypothetical protein ACRCYR_05390 [Phycicoccus sp.]
MTAHVATGVDRDRIGERRQEVDPRLDDYAASRTAAAPVIVLSPAPPGGAGQARTHPSGTRRGLAFGP